MRICVVGIGYVGLVTSACLAESGNNVICVDIDLEKVDKINSADAMIFQTEKQLKDYGDKLPADKKEPIEKALEELKTAHKSQDLDAIDTAVTNLGKSQYHHKRFLTLQKDADPGTAEVEDAKKRLTKMKGI